LSVASNPWNVVTSGVLSRTASGSAETPSIPKCAWITDGRWRSIKRRYGREFPVIICQPMRGSANLL